MTIKFEDFGIDVVVRDRVAYSMGDNLNRAIKEYIADYRERCGDELPVVVRRDGEVYNLEDVLRYLRDCLNIREFKYDIRVRVVGEIGGMGVMKFISKVGNFAKVFADVVKRLENY